MAKTRVITGLFLIFYAYLWVVKYVIKQIKIYYKEYSMLFKLFLLKLGAEVVGAEMLWQKRNTNIFKK